MNARFAVLAALFALNGCIVKVHDGDTGTGAGNGTGGSASTTGGAPSSGGSNNGGAGGAGGLETGGGGSAGGTGVGGGPPMCDAPPNPAAFEVGTGEVCYTRLADLDVVDMMSGPQGGYHVWFAFGCTDCTADSHIKWGVKDPVTGLVINQTYDSESFFTLSGAPFRQVAGIQHGMPGGFFNDPPDPLPPGTHVIMWAQLLDDQGMVKHEDEVEVVIGDVVPWDPCVNDPNCPDG